ncbi:MAG: NAD-dependent epimerase/dehydratase family protein [Bacteroidetes bacterium]|nr:NAD-dependent epimerase/dehydratase family protein [Bacteroidota bacterium]
MILVTGASGLVGQHLLEALTASGVTIRAMYRKSIPKFYTNIQSKYVQWVEADLLDLASLDQAFEQVTHVYHCAAWVNYDPRLDEEMLRVNAEGTANVVNMCLHKKIIKLCYVSSISTIGSKPNNEAADEQTEIEEGEQSSNYSLSKVEAEMEVWRGIAEGLNAVIINPGIILGEGDDSRSSTKLFKIVQKEFPYYTLGSTAWVDVKDVVKIMIGLMNHEIHSERFIVSAGNFSYKEIFSMMAQAMNKREPYIKAGRLLTEIVWRMVYLKSIITGEVATITKSTARSSQSIRLFNPNKLLQVLPNYHYISIDETIRRIASKYK